MAHDPRSASPQAIDRAILDAHSRSRHDRARGRHQWKEDVEASLTASGIVSVLLLVALWLSGVLRWDRIRFWEPAVAIPAAFGAFACMVWIVHRARHLQDPAAMRLPPYLPPRCTLFDGEFYMGSAYTYDGRGPGEWLLPDDEPLDPHVTIRDRGIYSSIIIDGVPGSGKTKGAIYKILAQAVRMYPAPPPLPRDARGGWIALAEWDSLEFGRMWKYWHGWRARVPATFRTYTDRWFGGTQRLTLTFDPLVNAAYGRCTSEEDAIAREAALQRRHAKQRPTIIVLNPKQEDRDDRVGDFVRACAAVDSPERLAQVKVISPEYGTSIAMFDLRRESADLGDSIRKAIDIIDGKGDDYYAQQATSLLTHCIQLLRVLRPGRVNWHEVLRVCSQIEYAAELVQEAETLFEQQLVDERENRSLDRPPVDPNALTALARLTEKTQEDWDKFTSRIQAFGRYILNGDMGPVLAAEVPTFGSWDEVLAEGGIVVIDLPMSSFGEVARASSILLINAFINAAMDYGARTVAEERRASLVVLDEAHLFLSDQLARATAMARSAQVSFTFAIQTYAQMDEAGRTMRQTIATNCGNKFSYRESEGHAAQQKAETHGQKEELVRDTATGESFSDVTEALMVPGSPRSVNRSATERTSLRDVYRFKPEVFMSLPTGRAVAQITDGRTPQPSRLISTPECRDVIWLADVDRVRLAPYDPPIPITVIDGSVPSARDFDRLWYLYYFEDAKRGQLLGLSRLLDGHGQVGGVVIWNDRFAFAVAQQHLAKTRPVLERAFAGGIRVHANLSLSAPPLYLASVQDAVDLRELLGVKMPRPLPAREAWALLGRPAPETEWPTRWDTFLDSSPAVRERLSHQLRRLAREGAALQNDLRALDRGILLQAADEWEDALQPASRDTSASAAAPEGASTHPTTEDVPPGGAPTVRSRTSRAPASQPAPSLEHLIALFGGASPDAAEQIVPPKDPAAQPPESSDEGHTAASTSSDRPGIPRQSTSLGTGGDSPDGGGAGPLVVPVPTAHPPAAPGTGPRPGSRTRPDDAADFVF
ncbi:MAG: TraM recognition domain-containing protein [Gemmatimonadaceae bacterium]|nr:TraM recognition domain-containing protein [Gemmatimonadaceae bacterium]